MSQLGSGSAIRRCLLNVRVSPRKQTSMRVLARLHKCQLPDSCAASNAGVFIQSALIPADVMTFVHFSVSARQNSAKFWGEPIFGLALNLARLASSSGERRISLIDA